MSRRIGRRLWYLLNRPRVERELELEMGAHRDRLDDARRFGDTLRLREATRDVWGWNWLDDLARDARYACRRLRRSPGFALGAFLILSLGTGVNLTFFQLLNAAFLQPLTVRQPETLVHFDFMSPRFSSNGVPYPATEFVRRHNDVLSAVLTETSENLAWADDASERLTVSFVSANWFAELGYGAGRGRVFREDIDERAGAAPVIVLSHAFWQTRLGGNPDIAGSTVRVNGQPGTVIGVAPAEFPGLDRFSSPQLWIPIHQIDYFLPGSAFRTSWDRFNSRMYGRLRAGISPAAAKDGLRAPIRDLARQRPDAFKGDEWLEPYTGSERFLSPRERRELWTIVSLVSGLTLLVLLVACANLGNLVLSRGTGRVRELALRAALGASRRRVVRQLLTENLVLALAGAAGGMALAYWTSTLLASATAMPPYLDLTPDWRTVVAAAVLASLAMLAVGLLPAWKVSRQDHITSLKDGGQQMTGSLERARVRQMLVAAQVAGSCLLLVVAGLMVRGLQRLLTSDPGFTFGNVAVLDASLGRYGITGTAAQAYWDQVKRAVASYPGTEMVALTSNAPLGGSAGISTYNDAPQLRITTMNVDPEFFALMQIPILAGRNFAPGDDHRSTVIVSRRLALAMYGTVDVLGRTYPRTGRGRTIIGVAGDARVIKIKSLNGAEQYAPLDPDALGGALLLARAAPPERLLKPMRDAAHAADPRVLASARLMKDDFEETVQAPRLMSAIAAAAGLLTLCLACVGIFGVVSYGVTVRTKEIGVRLALGAERSSIVWLLLRQVAWPFGAGMILGIAGAVPVGKLLEDDPFNLRAADTAAYASAFVVFALVGGLAALVPAWRVVRFDPLRALRHE